MYLLYNNIPLELLTIDQVNRESVWTPDGVDLLFVRWRISVSCVYAAGDYMGGSALSRQPQSTAGRSSFTGRAPTGDEAGTVPLGNITGPLVTDKLLRNRLFRNRKKLFIGGYDELGNPKVWLESPVTPATCDADNGPKIHACNVVSVTGAPNHFAIQMEIETCLPPTADGSDRPLLAHRWQMTHTHDENFYLTRTINGQAIFHPGLMDHYAKNPDWFRSQLFHPIPMGFKRTLGPVTLSSDGCVLQYEYSDSDTTVMFNAGDSNATQMEVKEEVTYITPTAQNILDLINPFA